MTDPAFSTRGPACPYCLHLQMIDEASFYDESGYELDCSECCRKFIVQPNCSWTWVTRPMPEVVSHDNSEVA